MGTPALADDPRFVGAADRTTNHDELDGLIGEWTRARDLEAIEGILVDAQVPGSRIYTIADLFGDPQVRARGAIVHAPDSELGSIAMAEVVPRLSATPGKVNFAGGQVGINTREVLETTFGFEKERVDALLLSGVIAEQEVTR